MFKTIKTQILSFLGGWVAFTYLAFATLCLFYVLGKAFPGLKWMQRMEYAPHMRAWLTQNLWMAAIIGASIVTGLNVYQWIQRKKRGE